MDKPLLYLDNCCFNRPFDDQNYISIKIEADAKLHIQEKIKESVYNHAWSYILDFENLNNPFEDRRIEINKWKDISSVRIEENSNILIMMNKLILMGFKPIDSLHISCAINLNCNYFLTVDKNILKKSNMVKEIKIKSPVDFILMTEE
jgi:hypothetical protein